MDEDRPFVEEVLDHVLYAPLGLAVGIARSVSDAIGNTTHNVSRARDLTFSFARTVGAGVIDHATELGHVVAGVVGRGEESPQTKPVFARSKSALEIEMPFANYDNLPTVELIAMLRDLSPNDRDRVRAFEVAHRNRRTVLGCLSQLDDQSLGS